MLDEVVMNNQSAQRSSIALVVLYYGTLPNYFNLTLATIRQNPSINWIIIGDVVPPSELPENINFIHIPLNELSQRFSSLGLGCATISSPYEICSMQPTIGAVFHDYLSSYDYWGHSDLDLLYGDLRHFLPEEVLKSHDRVYCRGHLSIYRNEERVNSAFQLQTPDTTTFANVLKNPSNQQFDEWKGIHRIMRYHGFHQYHKEVIADIRPSRRYRIDRFETTELPNYENQLFYWYNGKTYRAYLHPEGGIYDEEVAYIHFQKRSFPAPDPKLHLSGGFGIGPSGFFPYNREPLTPDQFSELNSGRWKSLPEISKEFFGRIHRKLKSVNPS
jgi:hypothetical protein